MSLLSNSFSRPTIDGDFYVTLWQLLDQFLSNMVAEGYAPPDAAEGMVRALHPDNYNQVSNDVDRMMESFYTDVLGRVRRAFGNQTSYHEEELSRVVAEWGEDNIRQEIDRAGWYVDQHSRQWVQKQVRTMLGRTMGSRLQSGLTNRNYPADAPIRGYSGRNAPSLGMGNVPSRNVGGNWSSMISDDANNAPLPSISQRGSSIMDSIASDDYGNNRIVRSVKTPEPVTAVEDAIDEKRESFTYAPVTDKVKNHIRQKAAKNYFNVTKALQASGDDGSSFQVFDAEFDLVSGDVKTVMTFAQTMLAGESWYFLRANYTRVVAVDFPSSLYARIQAKIVSALSDICNDDKPGKYLDQIVYNDLTRNDGRRVEKLIVDEFNRHLRVNFFNALKPDSKLEITEFTDIDDLMVYRKYLDMLATKRETWEKGLRFTLRNVLQTLFAGTARRIDGSNEDDYRHLAHTDVVFVHNGLRLSDAIACRSDVEKRAYFDAFFKRHLVLLTKDMFFYTDFFEHTKNVPEYACEVLRTNAFTNALFNAFVASESNTNEKGLTLGHTMNYPQLLLFSRTATQCAGYEVAFSIVPTPNLSIKRNTVFDMGFVNVSDEDNDGSYEDDDTDEDPFSDVAPLDSNSASDEEDDASDEDEDLHKTWGQPSHDDEETQPMRIGAMEISHDGDVPSSEEVPTPPPPAKAQHAASLANFSPSNGKRNGIVSDRKEDETGS